MIRLFFYTFLLTIPLCGIASTDEPVEQLINQTLAHHPSIKASRQVIKSAESGIDSAKWGYFPTPSVEYSQGSNRGLTARLDQPLWTGGKLDAAYDLATLQKNESEYLLDENAYRLIETLLQYVQSYQKATRTIAALEEGKRQMTLLRFMLERRITAGVSSKADQELIRSRLSSIQADLNAARTLQQMSREQIEILSGEQAQGSIMFNSDLIQAQHNAMPYAIDDIRSTHPSLKRLAVRTEMAKTERDRAKAVLWPNVSLRGEYTNGSVYTDTRITDSLVYVSAQMSPGAGLSAFSGIESATSKILQAQFDQQTKERELIDAGVRDYSNFKTSQERIAMMSETIHSAQAVFDSYTRLFIAGKRQWLDLVNSSRELTQYKTSLADLESSLQASAYQLALKRGQIPLSTGAIQ